jgi:hypothetical protein
MSSGCYDVNDSVSINGDNVKGLICVKGIDGGGTETGHCVVNTDGTGGAKDFGCIIAEMMLLVVVCC